jgi:hypothetical protein
VLERARRAEYSQQPLTATAARNDPDEHLALTNAKGCGVGGVTQVAGERDLQAAVQGWDR